MVNKLAENSTETKFKFKKNSIQFQNVEKPKESFVKMKSIAHENIRFFITLLKAQQAIKRLFKLEKNNSLHSSFYLFNNAL